MANEKRIKDPVLLSVIEAASKAREQSLAILDLLEQYHDAPEPDDSTEQMVDVSKQHKILNAYLAQLRSLSRKAVMSVRRTKQETSEARQEIDSLHLQLQNLYYEQNHLKGEILACDEYKHRYLDLSMTSKEDFIDNNPEIAGLPEHELTVCRIEDEHQRRQALLQERQELQTRKDVLTKETDTKKEELAKLDTAIEKWLSGEADIRKVFEAREQKSVPIEAQ